ncbi:hypothetical protein GCM10011504_47790 [Siccirubricoccus deserti]|nr:hypothetical protein GCM10011504_47790 [Siccirubricoccus deserti]
MVNVQSTTATPGGEPRRTPSRRGILAGLRASGAKSVVASCTPAPTFAAADPDAALIAMATDLADVQLVGWLLRRIDADMGRAVAERVREQSIIAADSFDATRHTLLDRHNTRRRA